MKTTDRTILATAACPAWCRADHRNDAPFARHVTADQFVALSCHQLGSSEFRAIVYGQHNAIDTEPTVHVAWIDDDGDFALMLQLDEAEQLVRTLQKVIGQVRAPEGHVR